MNTSTLDSLQSVRMLKAMDDLTDQQIQREASGKGEFLRACAKGDANAISGFAPMVTDWAVVRAPVIAGDPLPRRLPALSELMAESLDYQDGPSMTEAMQLILNAANGADVRDQANGLLDRMATTWAKFNSEVME